jgi:hypothetical protein
MRGRVAPVVCAIAVGALCAVARGVLTPEAVLAHDGDLDSRGCHNDLQRGGYHCHRGELAGQSFGSAGEAAVALAKRSLVPGDLVDRTLVNQGIHEAAKVNGGELTINSNLETAWRARPRNLDDLVRSAPVIVLGTVQSAAPRITQRGLTIETVYEVMVTETLRGRERSQISVRAPGGRMEFPDGAVAEVRTPGFSIEIDRTYLWFLRPPADTPGVEPEEIARDVHLLTVGPQGLFDLSMGRVRSLARADNLIRAQHDGNDAQGFLTAVRAAIQKLEPKSR